MLEPKSGLIAYIGADWNIYTSDQAGNHRIAYTKDAAIPSDNTGPFRYYGYPTWAPDGERIGFVGIGGQGSKSSAQVFIADVEDLAQKVFSSDSEHPFYLYWSPDSTNLQFPLVYRRWSVHGPAKCFKCAKGTNAHRYWITLLLVLGTGW